MENEHDRNFQGLVLLCALHHVITSGRASHDMPPLGKPLQANGARGACALALTVELSSMTGGVKQDETRQLFMGGWSGWVGG